MAHDRSGYIYVLKGGDYYKIGLSKNVTQRIGQISPKMPFETEIVHTVRTNDMYRAEKGLHERFADKRTNGEWFALEPADIDWLSSLFYLRSTNEGVVACTLEQYIKTLFYFRTEDMIYHYQEYNKAKGALLELVGKIESYRNNGRLSQEACFDIAESYYLQAENCFELETLIFGSLFKMGTDKEIEEDNYWGVAL